jgi:hypothetical protein
MMPSFASATIPRHILRGLIGLAAFAAAPALGAVHPLLTLVAFAAALIALRGCPLCWLTGMIQLISAKLQGEPTDGLCIDGSCALPRPDQP